MIKRRLELLALAATLLLPLTPNSLVAQVAPTASDNVRLVPTFAPGAVDTSPTILSVGDLLASSTQLPNIDILDAKTGLVFARVKNSGRPLLYLYQGKNGQVFLARDNDPRTKRARSISRRTYRDGRPYSVDFNAVGEGAFELLVDGPNNPQKLFRTRMTQIEPYRNAISSNGQILASISIGRSDFSRRTHLYEGDFPFSYEAAWTPRTLEIWNTISGERLFHEPAAPGLLALSVSNDGRYVAQIDYGVGDNRLLDGSDGAETTPRPDVALLSIYDTVEGVKTELLVPINFSRGGNPSLAPAPTFMPVEGGLLRIPPITAGNVGQPTLVQLSTLSVASPDDALAEKWSSLIIDNFLAHLGVGIGRELAPDAQAAGHFQPFQPVVWDAATNQLLGRDLTALSVVNVDERQDTLPWFRWPDGRLSWASEPSQPLPESRTRTIAAKIAEFRDERSQSAANDAAYKFEQKRYSRLPFGKKNLLRIDVTSASDGARIADIKTKLTNFAEGVVHSSATQVVLAGSGKSGKFQLVNADAASGKILDQVELNAPDGTYNLTLDVSDGGAYLAVQFFGSDAVDIYRTDDLTFVVRLENDDASSARSITLGNIAIYDDEGLVLAVGSDGALRIFDLQVPRAGRLLTYAPATTDRVVVEGDLLSRTAEFFDGAQTLTLFCDGQTSPTVVLGNEVLAGLPMGEGLAVSEISALCGS